MRPDEEKELLARIRNIDANTSEEVALVREIKLWRKFVAWAFGIASTGFTIWEMIKSFKGQ